MIKRVIGIIFWEIEYRAFEFFNSTMFLAFGIAILYLPSTQRVIKLSIGGEYPWISVAYSFAVILIIFGMLQLIAVISNKGIFRRNMALSSSFIWTAMFVIFNQYPVKSTSLAFFIVLILFTAWSFIRLVIQHKAKRLLDPRDSYGR